MTEGQTIADVLEGRADWIVVTGDCLEVLPTIPAGSVGAVVTDPPYGRARDNHGWFAESRGMLQNDDDAAVGQAAIDWASGLPLAAFASPHLPWRGAWRNLIVWDKGGAVAGGGDPTTCLKLSWELVQVARNGPLVGGRGDSVWRHVVTPNDFEDHPTQKPVPLMVRLLDTLFSCAPIVLDPFCGSGTAGVACVKTGRRFVGIEIDAGYADIARRRIREAEPVLFTRAESRQLTLGGGE